MGQAIRDIGAGHLKIGDLAKLTGKTVRALHFYEEKGILSPVARTEGGFRLYSADSVSRVGLIDKLQSIGMTLPDIQAVLTRFENSETGRVAAQSFRLELIQRRKELDAEIEKLTRLRSELAETVDYLAYCAHSCAKESGAAHCERCGHAADEDERPDIVSGLYA